MQAEKCHGFQDFRGGDYKDLGDLGDLDDVINRPPSFKPN
jgi:hypothetical protein